jgi:hypothetical protein
VPVLTEAVAAALALGSDHSQAAETDTGLGAVMAGTVTEKEKVADKDKEILREMFYYEVCGKEKKAVVILFIYLCVCVFVVCVHACMLD